MAASRLQLASRIQFAVQRTLNIHVDVSEMLMKPDYAEEILQLCRAMPTEELMQLAGQFEQASLDQRRLRRLPGTRPKDLAQAEVRIRRPNGSPEAARTLRAVRPVVAPTLVSVPVPAPAPAAATRPQPVSLSGLAAQVRDHLQSDTSIHWWPARRLAGA